MFGAAVALPDGRAFVAGGCYLRYPFPEGAHVSVEFCNLQSNYQSDDASEFWQLAAPMIHTCNSFAIAYFKRMVIAAGSGPEGQEVEVFSPPDVDHRLGQWTQNTTMSALQSCSALLICNDRLFAFVGD
ncbi:unnamed protein product [Dibothriocephalus latus]|uniref:Uncharacterized protein n=1 Tax=Dibothriocephalus latus TaxID=60516 RepID=A0A3P7NPC3_DIBLA|nr:unnamed protein product [Dibothriocephalus latus]